MIHVMRRRLRLLRGRRLGSVALRIALRRRTSVWHGYLKWVKIMKCKPQCELRCYGVAVLRCCGVVVLWCQVTKLLQVKHVIPQCVYV